jgi:hypothetical protein
MALSVLPNGRRQYAEAFLELSSIHTRAPIPLLGVSTGDSRTFKRRFTMMLSEKVTCRISLLGLIAVALVALIALPSWSFGQLRPPASLQVQPARLPIDRDVPRAPEAGTAEAGDDQDRATTPQLEARVQKLEEKLDVVLQELQRIGSAPNLVPQPMRPGFPGGAQRNWRADRSQPGTLQVIRLKHATAQQIHISLSTLGTVDFPGVTVGVDERTNSVLLSGPAEQIKVVVALIEELDVPVDPASEPLPAGNVADADPAAKSWQIRGKLPPRGMPSDMQLDLVSLGTAIIDAQGAQRLSSSQLDRTKKLGPAVSREEVVNAEIALETAQRKVDLLTAIVQGLISNAKAEVEYAEKNLNRMVELEKRKAVPRQQLDEAEAKLVSARGKLELLTFILKAHEPPPTQN